jgi:hypothetical protein
MDIAICFLWSKLLLKCLLFCDLPGMSSEQLTFRHQVLLRWVNHHLGTLGNEPIQHLQELRNNQNLRNLLISLPASRFLAVPTCDDGASTSSLRQQFNNIIQIGQLLKWLHEEWKMSLDRLEPETIDAGNVTELVWRLFLYSGNCFNETILLLPKKDQRSKRPEDIYSRFRHGKAFTKDDIFHIYLNFHFEFEILIFRFAFLVSALFGARSRTSKERIIQSRRSFGLVEKWCKPTRLVIDIAR